MANSHFLLVLFSAFVIACSVGEDSEQPITETPAPARTPQLRADDLASFRCETQEAAKELRRTSKALEILGLGCGVLHIHNHEVVGEEDGLIKLKDKRDGSIRWTIRQEERAPPPEPTTATAEPTPQIREERAKRWIFAAIVRAEDRAD